jgi:hypothetical protein
VTRYLKSYSVSHPADDGNRARPADPNAPHHDSYTALRPVVNYVSRPLLRRQIKEQLHDARYDATDTRILPVQGLGGSGQSQLVLNSVREYREDYSTIFWVEAGQRENQSSGATVGPTDCFWTDIDDGDDESYINLEFFLPDAPTADVIITTRLAWAAEMMTLGAVEVGEVETMEAAELFQKCAKLKSPGPGMDTEG